MTRFKHRKRSQPAKEDPAVLRVEQRKFAEHILRQRAKFAVNDPTLLRWAESIIPGEPFPCQHALEFARED